MKLIADILDVFRPLRWYRNGFMLLGVILAIRLDNIDILAVWKQILFSFLGLCFIASGNYGINEILDAATDRYHPTKRERAIPTGRISKKLICLLSLGLYLIGFLVVLYFKNTALSLSIFLLALSGVMYNVAPIRLKDKPYLDFIAEAFNNPIRLMVGWYATSPSRIVPSSFIAAFWSLGIFLMASKRFGELRFINDIDVSAKYRKSLEYYSEKKLLFSMIGGICTFNFMFGALSLKYSSDLIIILPFLIIWIIWFFALSYEKDTIVKDPERIFSKKGFFSFSLILFSLFVILLFSNNRFMAFVKW